jgi:hypothetical protein
VALLSGFAPMTLQMSVNRIAAISFGSSPFTFATVVAVFVLAIAVGSYVVSALPRIPKLLLPASQWVLVLTLLLLYGWVPDGPYWAHVLRASFRDSPELFYPYHFVVFGALLLLLLLPLAVAGATLPLLFHRLRGEVGELGEVAGRLYGWNTLGSLLGALLGGYALLLWLDLNQVFRLAVAALAIGAGLLTWRSVPWARAVGVALTAGVLLVAIVLPAWPEERLASGTFRLRQPTANTYAGPDVFYEGYLRWPPDGNLVAFYQDDPVASIAVLRLDFGESIGQAVVTNGKNDSAFIERRACSRCSRPGSPRSASARS